MDVLIVGAGAVGRWVGDLLDWPVTFVDVDPAQADAAADAVGERATSVPLDGTPDSIDLVVIAVPMRVTTDAIHEHAPLAERAVVDFTGSMQAPLSAMSEAVADIERTSFHPLFAPEHAPGRVAVSTGVSGPVTDTVCDKLEEAGNELVEVTPEEHDEAMKTVQGRAHAAIIAFAMAADPVPDGLRTPVFDDLRALADRVTGNQARVYADIQSVFDGAEDVETAVSRLAAAEVAEFEALYDDAG